MEPLVPCRSPDKDRCVRRSSEPHQRRNSKPTTFRMQGYSALTGFSTDQTDESTVSGTPPPRMRTETEEVKKKPTKRMPFDPYLEDEITPKKIEQSAMLFTKPLEKDQRKVSTGTLNRLILVAQALESEVDSRRQTDISGGKIVFSIRMANMILLILVNVLLFTGVGQYYDRAHGGHRNLLLTADKWMFSPLHTDLPNTFQEMRLNAQFFAASITVSMLLATVTLQIMHVCHSANSRLLSMCYSFGAVPFSLFVFGLEMHYSACPWLDEYYHLIAESHTTSGPMDAQCGINGWALAGIFALLSCGLFVSEGLITAFFRNENHNHDKKETIL